MYCAKRHRSAFNPLRLEALFKEVLVEESLRCWRWFGRRDFPEIERGEEGRKEKVGVFWVEEDSVRAGYAAH